MNRSSQSKGHMAQARILLISTHHIKSQRIPSQFEFCTHQQTYYVSPFTIYPRSRILGPRIQEVVVMGSPSPQHPKQKKTKYAGPWIHLCTQQAGGTHHYPFPLVLPNQRKGETPGWRKEKVYPLILQFQLKIQH